MSTPSPVAPVPPASPTPPGTTKTSGAVASSVAAGLPASPGTVKPSGTVASTASVAPTGSAVPTGPVVPTGLLASPAAGAAATEARSVTPGGILFADDPVVFNEGLPVTRLTVLNTADRPVQIGSHYHFAEANPGLDFDRGAARGLRLNIAAGTAVRFEPGIPVDIELVPFAGLRRIPGLRGETGGALDG